MEIPAERFLLAHLPKEKGGMYKMRTRYAILLGILATVSTSFASTIYSQSGSPGFGFNGQTDFVIGLQTTSFWQNVVVTMPLEDLNATGPISGVEGTFYLTNQSGPGTTVANQVAVDQVSGLGSSFTPVTVFSGLSLGPGSYYIVMVPTDNSGGGGGWTSSPEGYSSPAPVTVGPGVTDLGIGESLTLASYPPAGTLCCGGFFTPNNLFVTITGDPVSTPEPSAFLLLLAGATMIAIYARFWKALRDKNGSA
jgi:hypothetical protein